MAATVEQALRMRANAWFGVCVRAIMDEKGIGSTELRKRIYGVRDDGSPIPAGQYYDLMQGKYKPLLKTRQRWADALGVPLERLTQGSVTTRWAAQIPKPPAKTIKTDVTSEQFSLVIGSNGRASLRLNMVDIPMNVALRAMHALTGAGLLGPESDKS